MEAVKVSQNIAIHAVKAHLVNALRTWLLLRSIDKNGEGRVLLDDLYKAEQGRRHRTSVDRVLKQGEGLFWTIVTNKDNKKVIRLTGLERLYFALHIHEEELFTRRCVWVPVSVFDYSIANFRAAMYSLFFATRKTFIASGGVNAPISRKVIHELVGPCDRTQRRYDKKAKIEKSFNYCPHPALEAYPGMEKTPDRKAFFVIKIDKDRYCQVEQLPNSFAQIIEFAPCRKLRNIYEITKNSRDSHNVLSSDETWEIQRYSLKNKRRYYFKAKALAKRRIGPDRGLNVQKKTAFLLSEKKQRHNIWSVNDPLYDSYLREKNRIANV